MFDKNPFTNFGTSLAQANLLAQSIRFRRVVESAKELELVTSKSLKTYRLIGMDGIFFTIHMNPTCTRASS